MKKKIRRLRQHSWSQSVCARNAILFSILVYGNTISCCASNTTHCWYWQNTFGHQSKILWFCLAYGEKFKLVAASKRNGKTRAPKTNDSGHWNPCAFKKWQEMRPFHSSAIHASFDVSNRHCLHKHQPFIANAFWCYEHNAPGFHCSSASSCFHIFLCLLSLCSDCWTSKIRMKICVHFSGSIFSL